MVRVTNNAHLHPEVQVAIAIPDRVHHQVIAAQRHPEVHQRDPLHQDLQEDN